jgi:hypothetical protein
VSGNRLDKDIFVDNLFSNEMVVDFDVLSTSMINGVGSESECTNVVTPDHRRDKERDAKILEQHTEPVNFSGDGGQGAVFCLGAGVSNDRLFLGTPGNILVSLKEKKNYWSCTRVVQQSFF